MYTLLWGYDHERAERDAAVRATSRSRAPEEHAAKLARLEALKFAVRVETTRRKRGTFVTRGARFGRLTIRVVSRMDCKAICDCGSYVEGIEASNLVRGTVRSCGCLTRELYALRIPAQQWRAVGATLMDRYRR